MKKVTIALDDEAAALLIQLAGGPRKQGVYISRLVRAQARPDSLLTELTRMETELARLRAEVRRQLGTEGDTT